MTTPLEITAAMKAALEPLGVEIYDYMPDGPTFPCVAIYPEAWPYDLTQDATFVCWCAVATTDMQGAQQTLSDWLDGDVSIPGLLTADDRLGQLIGSLVPIEFRNWGAVELANGSRVLQAEVVVNVLR